MADLQARAGGGRLPQLYEATVHLQLRLGLVSRLLSLVSCACHGGVAHCLTKPCCAHMVYLSLQVVNNQQLLHTSGLLSYHFLC